MCKIDEGTGGEYRGGNKWKQEQIARQKWNCRVKRRQEPFTGGDFVPVANKNKMDPAGSGEQFAVGYRLAIKTTFGDDFEGHVLTYDKSTNVVVIQESDSVGPTRRNLRFVKANYIKDCTLIGKIDETFDLKNIVPDFDSLRSREEAAIRQAELEAERIGVGVSQEAQDIFDALSKTLPVRWKETSIVVMTDVLVNSPYLPENVTGGTATANERVRKVLELERKRLQNRGTS